MRRLRFVDFGYWNYARALSAVGEISCFPLVPDFADEAKFR